MEMAHRRAQPASGPRVIAALHQAIAAMLPRNILSLLLLPYIFIKSNTTTTKKTLAITFILKSFKLPDLKHYQVAII